MQNSLYPCSLIIITTIKCFCPLNEFPKNIRKVHTLLLLPAPLHSESSCRNMRFWKSALCDVTGGTDTSSKIETAPSAKCLFLILWLLQDLLSAFKQEDSPKRSWNPYAVYWRSVEFFWTINCDSMVMYGIQRSILRVDLLYCHVTSCPVPCFTLCISFLLFKWMSHTVLRLFPVFSSFQSQSEYFIDPWGDFACISFFFLKHNKCDTERKAKCVF